MTAVDAGGRAPVWLDGRLLAGLEPDALAALLDRPGCYTTARVRAGAPTFGARHVARLRTDAHALGLPVPEERLVLDAFRALGRAVFGEDEGIVRVQAGTDDAGRLSLLATARPLHAESGPWRAVIAEPAHPGPARAPGAKCNDRPIHAEARGLARASEVDEVLLFDSSGALVEGARSNLLVVDARGAVRTPDPGLGAVAGIALAVLRDHAARITPARLDRDDVRAAHELIAVNAVRGVRPIVALDGAPIGDGQPGTAAHRLAAVFDAALQEESRAPR